MHKAESYLDGLEFPASKQDVIATAVDNDAPQQLIEALQALQPERFNSDEELGAALD